MNEKEKKIIHNKAGQMLKHIASAQSIARELNERLWKDESRAERVITCNVIEGLDEAFSSCQTLIMRTR